MKSSRSFSIISTFFLMLCSTSFAVAANDPAPSLKESYPLSTCVVSGDKLGQMEPPTILQYQGREVRFCCKDCVKDFQKNPEKYMKRLHDTTPSSTDTSTPLPTNPVAPQS